MCRIAAFCVAQLIAFAGTSGLAASAMGAEASTDTARRDAKHLADAGADAYAQGNFAHAHELFVQAYALVAAPTIALFEARALVQMKRLVEARAAYERASSTELATNEPAAFRHAVSEARAELVALDRRIPRYRVVVDEKSLRSVRHRVFVDGQLLSRSSIGAWIHADPGIHELRLGDARDASSERFELRDGETKSVRIDTSSSTDPMRTWGFVSLGVGAAGLAVGVSAGLVALDAHRDAERRCPNETCVRGSPGAAALERFEDYRTISTGGYALGAVGVVAGTVLLLGSSDESKPRVAVTSSFRHVSVETRF